MIASVESFECKMRPMIHEPIACHGAAHLEPKAGGLLLQRVPEPVRRALNERARQQMRTAGNMELRFAAERWPVRVKLSGRGVGWSFFGEYMAGAFTLSQTPAWHTFEMPERLAGALAAGERVPAGRFAPELCRLCFDPYGEIVFHAVEGEGVRPPAEGEVPDSCLLAYGTSITHGNRATAPYLTYPAQAAWRLGMDLVNLGSGGSAHCEPELADWIAAREDWRVATLALSVNMRAFEDAVFEARVRHMVRTIAGSRPQRPVAAITLWPYFHDLDSGDAHQAEGRRRILRRVVGEAGLENLHVLEGPEMLTRFEGLTGDLIHPSPLGMIEMGEALAARLAPLAAKPLA